MYVQIHMSDAQKRIALAVLFAAGIVSVALFMREGKSPTQQATDTVAVVTQAPERQAIAVIDENDDGVPDWQEALQITEPITVTGNPTAAYVPPETLTEQFALEFFEDMVRANNYGDFGDTPEELVAGASQSLTSQAYDTLLSSADMKTDSDNSPEALTLYGERVAQIMSEKQDPNPDSEAVILERALRLESAAELAKLDSKIEIYTYVLEETKALTAPNSVAKQHLDLLNSYQAMLSDIVAMRNAFNDPMLALLRMKRYEDDTSGLLLAIQNLYTSLQREGAVWGENSAVSALINLE